MSLNSLAAVLDTQFGQTSQHEDLDEAVSLYREALGLLPPSHPSWSGLLNNLANSLNSRFGQSGQHEDLDKAISLHHEALGLLPALHPN
jgi:hypothetical protein